MFGSLIKFFQKLFATKSARSDETFSDIREGLQYLVGLVDEHRGFLADIDALDPGTGRQSPTIQIISQDVALADDDHAEAFTLHLTFPGDQPEGAYLEKFRQWEGAKLWSKGAFEDIPCYRLTVKDDVPLAQEMIELLLREVYESPAHATIRFKVYKL